MPVNSARGKYRAISGLNEVRHAQMMPTSSSMVDQRLISTKSHVGSLVCRPLEKVVILMMAMMHVL